HTIISNMFALITTITETESKELFAQTGLEITFPVGEKKTKFRIDKGQFGNLALARKVEQRDGKLIETTFVAVKKIKGTKIPDSKNESAIQDELSQHGVPNVMSLLHCTPVMKDSKQRDAVYIFMPLAKYNGIALQHCLSKIPFSSQMKI